MARTLQYKYKGVLKQQPFSYDKYHDAFEAAAAAEGVDLTAFRKMEQQVVMTAKGKGALKDYRRNAFAALGFTDVVLLKEEAQS